MKRIDSSGDLDTMTTEDLQHELSESRDELEQFYMFHEVLGYIQKLDTIYELRQVRDFCKTLYEGQHMKDWGSLLAAKDNIGTIAANLAEDLQADILNRFCACMIDILQHELPEEQGKQYLEGTYTTPTLAAYLKPLMDARAAEQGE